jgi:hypothetical protein
MSHELLNFAIGRTFYILPEKHALVNKDSPDLCYKSIANAEGRQGINKRVHDTEQ